MKLRPIPLLAAVLALPVLTVPPAWTQEDAGRRRDAAMLAQIAVVDPETDPILAVIDTAVKPTPEQREAILGLYRRLRRVQADAFLGHMMARMEERMGGGGSEGDSGDTILPEVFARVEGANRYFLAETRKLLTEEQLPLWDACAADLQLQPMGNLPKGRGGNIDHGKPGPREGQPAPTFTLQDTRGREVALESLRGKPVVLEFGSLSCPMFRGKVDLMREVMEEFGDRVHWVVLYTREAHAAGTPRQAPVNRVVGIEIPTHQTFEDRASAARRTTSDLALARTVLIDDMKDSVTTTYGGFPNWGYVLDAEGNIASRQVWSDPGQIRRVLDRMLEGK